MGTALPPCNIKSTKISIVGSCLPFKGYICAGGSQFMYVFALKWTRSSKIAIYLFTVYATFLDDCIHECVLIYCRYS